MVPAAGPDGPTAAAVAALRPASLYADPCHDHVFESQTIDAGYTVAELVDAIAEVTSGDAAPYTATEPIATVISGFEGQRLDLSLPSDLDFATCEEGTFWVWAAGPYAQGVGNRWHLWILDVDGTRVVILGQDFETTATEVQDDLEAIVNSIRIEP